MSLETTDLKQRNKELVEENQKLHNLLSKSVGYLLLTEGTKETYEEIIGHLHKRTKLGA